MKYYKKTYNIFILCNKKYKLYLKEKYKNKIKLKLK